MKHTWKRWITAALALVLVAALFGCAGDASDKKTWTPGAFEQKDGNGDPAYSIRLPLSEDNTGICVSSTHGGTAIAMADLEHNQIDYIRVDHTTGEVTRWTTENVPLSDIYNLPLNTN